MLWGCVFGDPTCLPANAGDTERLVYSLCKDPPEKEMGETSPVIFV